MGPDFSRPSLCSYPYIHAVSTCYITACVTSGYNTRRGLLKSQATATALTLCSRTPELHPGEQILQILVPQTSVHAMMPQIWIIAFKSAIRADR